MHFEIAQREGKAVVDAHQRRHALGKPLHQPLGDAAPRPIFAKRERWRDFGRHRVALGQVNTKAIQARGRRQRARIVDADVAIKHADDTSSGQAPRSPASVTSVIPPAATLRSLRFARFKRKAPAELRAWPGYDSAAYVEGSKSRTDSRESRIIARALVSRLAHSR